MAKTDTTPKVFTPKQLSEHLGVDAKRIRAYLRQQYTRPDEAKNTSWMLDEAVAKEVIEHFAAKKTQAKSEEA